MIVLVPLAAPVSPSVWMVTAYALFLLAIAWAIDRFGARSAVRSARWRTGNFVYHERDDAWKCHQDQWLYPAAFDPEKRVIRYRGQHAICGRCTAKPTCSPSPGPRELTRAVDPWPHSEAGRFHRGLALAVAVMAGFLPLVGLFGARNWLEMFVLATVVLLVLGAGYPLAVHLWRTPSGFPEHLRQEGMAETAALRGGSGNPQPVALRRRVPGRPRVDEAEVDALVDRYATKWGIGERTPETGRDAEGKQS